MAIQFAGNLDDATYLAAIEDFAKAFPDDPALLLIQLDRSTLRAEHAEVLHQLDKLDRHVGGDPYIDALRSDPLRALGKGDEAVAAAKRAAQGAPEIVGVWWSLLTQQTASARYPDAMATLDVLRDRFGQDVSAAALGSDARFGALVASPEFAARGAE